LPVILFDHHTVIEARARGGEEFENGDLLTAAEAEGFQVLVTTDRNIRYQQNLAGRKIAIVVLGKGRWSIIKPHVAQIGRRRERRDARKLCRDWHTGIAILVKVKFRNWL
jgi:hypothetical protein